MGGTFMNVTSVDRTIRVLCAEIQHGDQNVQDWQLRTEEELLCEACVCIFSSQMIFEVAEAAAQRLKALGLLQESRYKNSRLEYEQCLLDVLSKPILIEWNGKIRHVRLRFHNRLASLLATTVTTMREQDQSLRKILSSSSSAREVREVLVKKVWGFGPKQASLFLRRVGYCTELAILDTHILDYLRVAKGINPKPSALSRLPGYERIEVEFKRVAAEFGHSIGCVDLAMWITMRVAKREAVW